MEQRVTVLQMEEPARFNPDRLERLCAEIGEIRAEHEVAKALEDISRHLLDIERIDPVGGQNRLAVPVQALVDASEHIGMATLARVGRDVMACLAHRDTVALAATNSRLRRVGDRSIHAIWDLENLSG